MVIIECNWGRNRGARDNCGEGGGVLDQSGRIQI